MHADGDGPSITLTPALALRPGRFDSIALWVVWSLRRSFLPLLQIGLISAAVVGQLGQVDPEQFRTPAELVRSLFGATATLQAGAAVQSVIALRDLRVESAWPLVFATIELWLLYGSDRTQEFFRR